MLVAGQRIGSSTARRPLAFARRRGPARRAQGCTTPLVPRGLPRARGRRGDRRRRCLVAAIGRWRAASAIRILETVVSHLVAYTGNEPEGVACALGAARSSLVSRGGENIEGWGAGDSCKARDVLLQKRPRVDAPGIDLYGASRICAPTRSSGTSGLAREGATGRRLRPVPLSVVAVRLGGRPHPHPQGGRDRSFEGWLNVKREIGCSRTMPDTLRRNIRGRSPKTSTCSTSSWRSCTPAPAPWTRLRRRPPSSTARAPQQHDVHRSPAREQRALARRCGWPSSRAMAAQPSRPMGRAPLRYLHVEGISDCPVCRGRVEKTVRGGRRVAPRRSCAPWIVGASRDVTRLAAGAGSHPRKRSVLHRWRPIDPPFVRPLLTRARLTARRRPRPRRATADSRTKIV